MYIQFRCCILVIFVAAVTYIAEARPQDIDGDRLAAILSSQTFNIPEGSPQNLDGDKLMEMVLSSKYFSDAINEKILAERREHPGSFKAMCEHQELVSEMYHKMMKPEMAAKMVDAVKQICGTSGAEALRGHSPLLGALLALLAVLVARSF